MHLWSRERWIFAWNCSNANCADNLLMGQDLCARFSPEKAITDQFTPPHFSMLHLSPAKSTWAEMKHGNGLCLWTLSKHSRIVCHMLHHAQVGHQNDFKLERIHPSCSCLVWAFTLSPLSYNRLLLIGGFFSCQDGCHIAGATLISCCFNVCKKCSCSVVNMQAQYYVKHRGLWNCFPLMPLWMSNRRARVNLPKRWYVYKHYLTKPDEYSVLLPGQENPTSHFTKYNT